MADDFVAVSGAAREITSRSGTKILPRYISRLFYDGQLRDDICPIIGGRRLIPRTYLPLIEQALRRHGFIEEAVAS